MKIQLLHFRSTLTASFSFALALLPILFLVGAALGDYVKSPFSVLLDFLLSSPARAAAFNILSPLALIGILLTGLAASVLSFCNLTLIFERNAITVRTELVRAHPANLPAGLLNAGLLLTILAYGVLESLKIPH